MFKYSSVGTLVWIIDSMLVKIFLYLGVGAFIWRNVSIFEFEYLNT